MAHSNFDPLRVLAIASQALGFILIITLETLMPDGAARPWQGVTLAVMVTFALALAVARVYRRNKVRKSLARRLADDDDVN